MPSARNRAELESLLDGVPLVSGEEGWRSLALVLAVYQAAGLGPGLPDVQGPLSG